ncbi:hypothetical protein fh0823_09850 [Francisella halioticida]|nr:hypothetical protein fh0823_09850 [Francisella halioticida]
MKAMKLNLKFLALVIIITLVSACVTSNIKYNNEGYSIVDIHKSLNDVYAKTLRLIESDQVSNSGSDSYTMNTNQKSDKKALIYTTPIN